MLETIRALASEDLEGSGDANGGARAANRCADASYNRISAHLLLAVTATPHAAANVASLRKSRKGVVPRIEGRRAVLQHHAADASPSSASGVCSWARR